MKRRVHLESFSVDSHFEEVYRLGSVQPDHVQLRPNTLKVTLDVDPDFHAELLAVANGEAHAYLEVERPNARGVTAPPPKEHEIEVADIFDAFTLERHKLKPKAEENQVKDSKLGRRLQFE